jgi:lipopolysaccharide export LptBFGC system permease protein LptF
MAWLRAVQRPFWAGLFSLVTVASVVVGAQIVLGSALVPGPAGFFRIWIGLVPEMLGVCAPIAALFASAAVSRLWSEGGDYRGMSAVGLRPQRLMPVVVLMGIVLCLGVGVCTHWLAPMGRAEIRKVLVEVASEATIRPGKLLNIGPVWLRVDNRKDGVPTGLMLASDQWVGFAETGGWADGGLVLQNGRLSDLEQRWALRFDSAKIPLGGQRIGVHNFERNSLELQSFIDAGETKGKDRSLAKITLYKRTTLALSAPFLLLAGLPIGLAFKRPAPAAITLVGLVWVAQRLGDHFRGVLGPQNGAFLPLLLLVGSVLLAWRIRWRLS